jgi:hypothetical protein
MRYLAITIPLLATIVAASAQAPARRADATLASFEVVSVKRNTNANAPVSIRTLPGRFTGTNVPLRLLINSAFRLAPDQYVGLPDWSESDRFDVTAKAPDGAGPDDMQPMLQSLLADRFKLVAHTETRDAPIYALVMARDDRRLGPQIAKSTMDCAPVLAARQVEARARGPAPVRVPALGQDERPVCGIRATRRQTPSGATLNGYIAVRATAVTSPDEGPSIFTALQEQLGLKLESTRGPVEYLVIDRIEKPEVD